MDSTLNYNIKFRTNADKITAGVDRLDQKLDNASKNSKRLASMFSKAMDKMNSKLSTIAMDSFVNNISHVADGLDAVTAPGLKLGTSLADLSAITDVTGSKLKEIEGYARQNAKTFGGDAASGVESYKLILSQLTPEIAKAPKALKAMGDQVSTLSKTMGGDTRAATEVLTTAMNQYQVSTADPIKASEEMSKMMNIMAAAAKEGSAELPEQKAALEQSGMAAKSANVSFAETAAAIQVLDKAGKKGSEGGVALRNTLATLSQGRFLPKDVQEELKAAGVDINVLGDKSLSLAERMKPLKGVMNDSALITKLFGKENNNAAIALISGIEEQERLTKAVQGTNTAYDQAAIVMEDQAEKNARLKARVDDFKISLYNATGGAIGYASVLGDTARDVGNLIPLFAGFGKMLQFVTSASKMQALWTDIISAKTKIWTAAQLALDIALSPVFLIPAAVIAIGAAIAWVVSKTEGWGNAWKHTVKGSKLLFQSFVAAGKAYFNTLVNGIMVGINKIKIGWYKLQNLIGKGDEAKNNNIIKQLEAENKARIEATKEGYKKAAKLGLESQIEFMKAAGSLKWKTEKEKKTQGDTGNGIAPPVVPGTGNGTGTNQEGTGTGGTNKDKTKTNKAIATGGTKHNYITIDIKSLIETLTIKGSDFKDSAKQMQDQSTDALIRTLALATSAGN